MWEKLSMQTRKYIPVFVSEIPRKLEEGYLYIAIEYNAIIHLCPCGCKSEISTPLNPKTGWTMKYDGECVSLSPSVGNYSYPCKSHYFIRDNKVIWVSENDNVDSELSSSKASSLFERLRNRIMKFRKSLK